MAVSEQTPYQEFIANGTTTVFPLNFDAKEQDHLIVLVDDVEPPVGDWSFDFNTDQVTFLKAPKANSVIKIRRDTPLKRDGSYKTYDNSFRPEPVNEDLDSIWYKLQEMGVLNWMINNDIKDLGAYVDSLNDETKAAFLAMIEKQGVSLNQLDTYVNNLYKKLTNIAVEKGWLAELIVDKSGKSQQQINDNRIKSIKDFGAVSGRDASVAIKLAIESESAIYLGNEDDVYYLSRQIELKNNLTIISDGAKFIAKQEIVGVEFSPKGLFDARNLTGVNIKGVIKTEIDHKLFTTIGDSLIKPTVIALLVENCTNCNFGFIHGLGAANYYYAQNFKEYGIIDVRNSTECTVYFYINGGYKEEIVASAPSTVGVFGKDNIRCIASGIVKNTYWSGILWEGIDCKVINPIVNNTKGSNLNLAGINTKAYNVDLSGSEQGNVSIGEGAEICYSCDIVGGEIRGARFANIAFHNSTKNCKVEANVTGWGQGATTTDVATVGVRIRGIGNEIKVNAFKERDGYISNGNAINAVTDSLTNPNTSGNHIKAAVFGAQVDIRAPKTTIDITISDVNDRTAVQMGYRCAGSHVKSVVGNNCLRAFAYTPDSANQSDSADVLIGSIVSNRCQNEPIAPLLTSRQSTRVKDLIYASDTSYKLNDVLYALEVITKDSSLNPAQEQLAAAIRVLSTDDFGTEHGLDFVASRNSSGNLISAIHKLRFNSFEIASAGGGASQLVCSGSDNKKYVLQPPAGGGAATWVVKP